MKVNDQKTQMVCISPSTHACNSYITTADNNLIESTDRLKLLGFVFSSTPTPHAQIENILTKYRKRLWSLRYLKKAGLGNRDMCRAYVTYLRPILEYGTVAIHSMLSQEQSDLLETQQARALKIIYGFHKSSGEVLVESGLDLLSDRRVKAVDKFAAKLVDDPKFSNMFPLRPAEQRRTRTAHKYLEMQAKTNRLYNSPFYYMRRRLNNMNTLTVVQPRPVPSALPRSQRCDFVFDEWR